MTAMKLILALRRQYEKGIHYKTNTSKVIILYKEQPKLSTIINTIEDVFVDPSEKSTGIIQWIAQSLTKTDQRTMIEHESINKIQPRAYIRKDNNGKYIKPTSYHMCEHQWESRKGQTGCYNCRTVITNTRVIMDQPDKSNFFVECRHCTTINLILLKDHYEDYYFNENF